MTEGHTADQTTQDTAFTIASPLAALDWWKSQPAQIGSLYAEILGAAENRLRRQADLLGELARCKSLPDMLSLQTAYVQDFWADAVRDAQKAMADGRRTFGGDA